jgi:hypothetical protein
VQFIREAVELADDAFKFMGKFAMFFLELFVVV